MSKRHDLVHGIKDNWVFQHTVVVELAEVLDFGDTALKEPVVVLLQSKRERFNDIVNDLDDKSRVIAVDGAQKDTKKMNASVSDLAGLGKDLFQNGNDFGLLPVKSPDQSQ